MAVRAACNQLHPYHVSTLCYEVEIRRPAGGQRLIVTLAPSVALLAPQLPQLRQDCFFPQATVSFVWCKCYTLNHKQHMACLLMKHAMLALSNL